MWHCIFLFLSLVYSCPNGVKAFWIFQLFMIIIGVVFGIMTMFRRRHLDRLVKERIMEQIQNSAWCNTPVFSLGVYHLRIHRCFGVQTTESVFLWKGICVKAVCIVNLQKGGSVPDVTVTTCEVWWGPLYTSVMESSSTTVHRLWDRCQSSCTCVHYIAIHEESMHALHCLLKVWRSLELVWILVSSLPDGMALWSPREDE